MDDRLREIIDNLECTTGMAILLYKKNNDIECLNIALKELTKLRNRLNNTEYKDRIDELIANVEFMKTNPTKNK